MLPAWVSLTTECKIQISKQVVSQGIPAHSSGEEDKASIRKGLGRFVAIVHQLSAGFEGVFPADECQPVCPLEDLLGFVPRLPGIRTLSSKPDDLSPRYTVVLRSNVRIFQSKVARHISGREWDLQAVV